MNRSAVKTALDRSAHLFPAAAGLMGAVAIASAFYYWTDPVRIQAEMDAVTGLSPGRIIGWTLVIVLAVMLMSTLAHHSEECSICETPIKGHEVPASWVFSAIHYLSSRPLTIVMFVIIGSSLFMSYGWSQLLNGIFLLWYGAVVLYDNVHNRWWPYCRFRHSVHLDNKSWKRKSWVLW